MTIVIEKEGRFFRFYSTGDLLFPLYFNCKKCGMELNREYSYIIWKLINANLLPKRYKTLCCRCNLLQNLVDNSKCPNCKSSLDYIIDKSDRLYHIISCTKCKFKKAVIL